MVFRAPTGTVGVPKGAPLATSVMCNQGQGRAPVCCVSRWPRGSRHKHHGVALFAMDELQALYLAASIAAWAVILGASSSSSSALSRARKRSVSD